ncbi:hypothetical protein A5635_13140 [Mycobacterium asiaticum]|uniref:Uncharacterized protein n=2 Tax=Mycobacterium asiaticum TaxID=1790 RepID=A0A1A3NZR9_MYCAS|nr:hypothetical protein A5635_13140 [Mycobacterium asiaticum]
MTLLLMLFALICLAPGEAAADSQPEVQVVVQLWDTDPDAAVRVAFGHLAAIYFLERNEPNFTAWHAMLRQSLQHQTPVRFTYAVAGQRITFVEPAG